MSSIPPELSSALSASLTAQTKLVKSTLSLDHALANSGKRGLPGIAISPAQGQQLSLLCKSLNATRVLEIGTLGGYSTLWFAAATPDMHVTSIEFNAKHRDVALENLQHAKLESKVDIRLGAALDILPVLAKEGKTFDFVFIDADWSEQRQYFDWAVKLTRKGGLVYVDNAVRQITETLGEGDEEGAMALVEAVAKDERVEASLIPTLNTHKSSLEEVVDGYLMAVVL